MERVVAPNGVVFYRSTLLASLGVRHAFSTRLGGVSPKPFDSLNLGNPLGCACPDSDERIEQNYARLCEAAHLPEKRRSVHQVHAAGVVLVRDIASGTQADAIVSNDDGVSASIRTADCAAVLIATNSGDMIGVVHAGWKGVVAGVVTKTLERLRELGSKPAAAAVFPCISFEAFEVGIEVVEAFRAQDLPAKEVGRGKGRVGVAESCAEQLRRGGVKEVELSGLCTVGRSDEFYSHRRDAGLTGRMALLAAPNGNGGRL